MRRIGPIVIHCSASRVGKDFTETDLEACHRQRGFNKIGYHSYIRKNDDVKTTRLIEQMGARTRGFNQTSIGTCCEGEPDCHGRPANIRTERQIHSMRVLVPMLLRDYPGYRVYGHRDLSPNLNGGGEIESEEWVKACLYFGAEEGRA